VQGCLHAINDQRMTCGRLESAPPWDISVSQSLTPCLRPSLGPHTTTLRPAVALGLLSSSSFSLRIQENTGGGGGASAMAGKRTWRSVCLPLSECGGGQRFWTAASLDTNGVRGRIRSLHVHGPAALATVSPSARSRAIAVRKPASSARGADRSLQRTRGNTLTNRPGSGLEADGRCPATPRRGDHHGPARRPAINGKARTAVVSVA
jgi:hypothetical protein